MIELAESLQLSGSELIAAYQSGKFQEKIKKDFLSGVYSGVNGTPAFYINGIRYNGSFEYEDLINAIEQMK